MPIYKVYIVDDNTDDDDNNDRAVAEADVSSCVSLHTSWRGERCEGALTLLLITAIYVVYI